MSKGENAQEAARLSRAVCFLREKLEDQLQLAVSTSDSKTLLLEAIINLLLVLENYERSLDISRAADVLVRTIDELDRATADLIAGAQAEAAENSSPVNAEMLSSISIEIERRSKWDREARIAQEALEDLCEERRQLAMRLTELLNHEASEDPLKDKGDKLALEAEVTSIERSISRMVASISDNDAAIAALKSFASAVELISKPPTHILGRPLPAIPEIKSPATV